MANEQRHLPPIGFRGSNQSMTSSADSAKKLSFARVSRLSASGHEHIRFGGRSLSQSSLPSYVTPRSRLHPGNVSDGCCSQYASNGLLNGVMLPDVTRSDLLKRNFLRLKCSSAVNRRSGETWSCPSDDCVSNITPRTARTALGSPIRATSGRIVQDGALLPRRAVSKSLTSVVIHVTSPRRRQATEVTPITEVTPVAPIETVSELSRLAELTRLAEVNRIAEVTRVAAPVANVRSDAGTTSWSTDSPDQSDDSVPVSEGTVSEETLNKCVNWLIELDKARACCCLDAVVETPVEWRD